MISLIVPTYNERENIFQLISKIESVLSAASIDDYEILVMDDDSPDGTAREIEELKDPKVRVVNRRGKQRGLSAAVIDGFGQTNAEIVGVMDADLSHPAELLPELIRTVRDGANIAVGSRYVKGGGIENWPLKREITSKVACFLARPITPVRDSTSGFFVLRKSILEGVRLNPLGFKIGLEVFVKARHGNKIKEVPYVFRDRKKGVSKFGPYLIYCYLKQIFILLGSKFS